MKIKLVFLQTFLVISIFLSSYVLIPGASQLASGHDSSVQLCKNTLLEWVTYVMKNGEYRAAQHVYSVLGTDKFSNSKGDPLSRWVLAFSTYLLAGATPQELGVPAECESFLGTGIDLSRLPKPSQNYPAQVFMIPTTTVVTTTLPTTAVQGNDRNSKMGQRNYGFNDAQIVGMNAKYLWVFNRGDGAIGGSSNSDYSIHPDRKPKGLLQISLKNLKLTKFSGKQTYCGVDLEIRPKYWKEACSNRVFPYHHSFVSELDKKTCPNLSGANATLLAEDTKYAWFSGDWIQVQLIRVALATGVCSNLPIKAQSNLFSNGFKFSGASDGSTFWIASGGVILAVDEATMKQQFEVMPAGFFAASNLIMSHGKLWVGTSISSKAMCPMFDNVAPCTTTFGILGLSPSSGRVLTTIAPKGFAFGKVPPDGFYTITLASDSKKLWVSCLDAHTIFGLSFRNGKFLNKIKLGGWWSGGQVISNGKTVAVVLIGTQGSSPQTIYLYSALTGKRLAILGRGSK